MTVTKLVIGIETRPPKAPTLVLPFRIDAEAAAMTLDPRPCQATAQVRHDHTLRQVQAGVLASVSNGQVALMPRPVLADLVQARQKIARAAEVSCMCGLDLCEFPFAACGARHAAQIYSSDLA